MITKAPPLVFRTARRRESSVMAAPPPPPPPPPPVALTLVQAIFYAGTWVRLTFDRAVEIDDLAAGNVNVAVDDGTSNAYLYQGVSGSLITPETVQVNLAFIGNAPGYGTLLTAGPGTGIVAVNDGGSWAGVTDLGLPYP